jgi:glycerol-3-phosphate dehydrogenase (NAD(P)+)
LISVNRHPNLHYTIAGMARIGILGGGAFGTAMACVLRRRGHHIDLWAREPEVVAAINREAANPLFLQGVPLVPGIRATLDMAALEAADFVLLAPPAQHMRAVTAQLRLRPGTPVVSCSKGIERGSLALMPEVLKETLPGSPVAVLSGPSFAKEIARDLPCGVALACADRALLDRLCREIRAPHFRLHPTDDVVGAALGGVMKNVIAIASGIAAGRGLGENARATLVTLGAHEAARLGAARGARAETFAGLAGIGDMMLTANSLTSRNTSLGYELGQGQALKDILARRKEVTEGAFSTEAVAALARRLDVPMPISQALDGLLNRGVPLEATLERMAEAM